MLFRTDINKSNIWAVMSEKNGLSVKLVMWLIQSFHIHLMNHQLKDFIWFEPALTAFFGY